MIVVENNRHQPHSMEYPVKIYTAYNTVHLFDCDFGA